MNHNLLAKTKLLSTWFVVLLVLFLIETPFFKIPFSANEGMFTHVAQEMRHGSKLYRDIWDHKPPLLFYHFVFLQDLFGNGEFPVRVYAVIFHFLDSLLLYLLVKKLGFNEKAANFAVWAYVFLLLPPYFQAWTPQAELLMQPFLISAFLLALSENFYLWAGAGGAWAASFFTKPIALIFLPLFFLLRKNEKMKAFGFFVLGADLIAIGVVLPFLMDGRLPLISDAIWGSNKDYVFQGWEYILNNSAYRQHVLWWHGIISLAYGLPLVASAFICSKKLVAEKTEKKVIYVFFLLWLLSSFLSCFVSGFFHTYYYFMFLPPLAVTAGIFLESMLVKNRFCFIALAAVMLFCLWLPWFRVSRSGVEGITNSEYIATRSIGSKEVGLYLKGIARPDQNLMVWASEAQIYTYSELKMAVLKSALGSPTTGNTSEWPVLKDVFTNSYPNYVVLSHFDQLVLPPNWLLENLKTHYSKLRYWDNYDLFAVKK